MGTKPSTSRTARTLARRFLDRVVCLYFATLFSVFGVAQTASAATPITLLDRFVGHTNYVATGGSFRTQPNTVNACSTATSSTALVSGVPSGATIRAVYLYWVGSGPIDSQVLLNGTPVTAERTDTAVFNFNGTAYNFFSGFAEISANNLVTGNGTYTLSGLAFATGNPYCQVQVVTGGWSLYVVYDEPSEPLHAVNIFDGFQFFRGSSINLTASGFRIPTNFVSGRFTFSHYDGDPQNSTPVGGFSEQLSLNGNALDDGIVAPASNPTLQPYDGTINAQGISTSHGVDVDTYNVTALLSPGDTSATVTMSAGGDLVLSTGMIIAVNTEPVSDLGITASQTGPFTPSASATVLATVSNNGPEEDANEIAVDFTLPPGLSYQAVSGGSWTCSDNDPVVNCQHPGPLPVGQSLADLALEVLVDVSIAATVDVDMSVSSASLDTVPENNQATESITIVRPDLSTSTKGVSDLNGGDATPGDTLRYTILLQNTANVDATTVSVTDDLPVGVTALNVISTPVGSADNSTPTGGANGSGFLDISDIVVPANGSTSIVFDVLIDASAVAGDVISNVAAVNNPNGPGTNALAPNVIVLASQVTASGTKTLYLYDSASGDPNGFNNGSAPYLSRTPPATTLPNIPVDKTQTPVTWRLSPALRSDLTLDAGTVPITVYVSKGGGGGNSVQRQLRLTLASNGSPLGPAVTQTFAAPPSGTPLAVTFNIVLGAQATLANGSTLTLTAENVTPGNGNRRIRVFPVNTGNFSRIDLDALTVINVDSVEVFDQPAPAGSAVTDVSAGQALSIRSTISDPFGSFDIASATVETRDPAGTVVATDAMTRIADSGLASADFEAIVTLPGTAAPGTWTFVVTGVEGVEGIVTHTRSTSVNLTPPPPALVFAKTVTTESDPVNGTSNPFNIPGAIAVYTLEIRNIGSGSPDADSLQLTDLIPADTRLVVAGPSDAVTFQDGAIASGMSLDFSNDVTFSSQTGGGPPYDHILVDAGDGTDPAVTGLSIRPSGQLAPDTGSGSPSFYVQFRVLLEN